MIEFCWLYLHSTASKIRIILAEELYLLANIFSIGSCLINFINMRLCNFPSFFLFFCDYQPFPQLALIFGQVTFTQAEFKI